MASRNIVVMQENGGGDCIVSRVRKVHQGSPYGTTRPTESPSPQTQKKLPCKPRSTEVTALRSVSRGNFYTITFRFSVRREQVYKQSYAPGYRSDH